MVERSSTPPGIIVLDKGNPRTLEDDEIADFYVRSRTNTNLIKECRPDLVSKVRPEILEQLDAGKSNLDYGEGSGE